MTRLASGAVALESADGVARVVLSAHGLVATVTYPLLFERKDDWTRAAAPEETDAEENEAGSRPTAFDYVWHTQTFAADACPSRWAFPVALLTAAAYTNGSEEEEEDASDANEATTPRKDASPSSDVDSASSRRLRAAGSATVLPHSASADRRAGRPRVPLWVDEGDDAEAEWWRSPSLAGLPPLPFPLRYYARRPPVPRSAHGLVATGTGGRGASASPGRRTGSSAARSRGAASPGASPFI